MVGERKTPMIRRVARGFTLVEMMVVISIIGLILSFAGRNNSIVLERSLDAALMKEVAALRNAVHQYVLDRNGEFPESLAKVAPSFLSQAREEWRGSRGRGRYHYDAAQGLIELYDERGEGPSTAKDAKGVPYGRY